MFKKCDSPEFVLRNPRCYLAEDVRVYNTGNMITFQAPWGIPRKNLCWFILCSSPSQLLLLEIRFLNFRLLPALRKCALTVQCTRKQHKVVCSKEEQQKYMCMVIGQRWWQEDEGGPLWEAVGGKCMGGYGGSSRRTKVGVWRKVCKWWVCWERIMGRWRKGQGVAGGRRRRIKYGMETVQRIDVVRRKGHRQPDFQVGITPRLACRWDQEAAALACNACQVQSLLGYRRKQRLRGPLCQSRQGIKDSDWSQNLSSDNSCLCLPLNTEFA